MKAGALPHALEDGTRWRLGLQTSISLISLDREVYSDLY